MLLSRFPRTIRPGPSVFARTSESDLVGGEHDLQEQDVSLTDKARSTRGDSRSGRTLSSNSSEVSLPRASVASLRLSRSAMIRDKKDLEWDDNAEDGVGREGGELRDGEAAGHTSDPPCAPSLRSWRHLLQVSQRRPRKLGTTQHEGSRSTIDAPS
jgi:hypothetical protein